MMIKTAIPLVAASLLATLSVPQQAMAQVGDVRDLALAFAQCVRDNGYAEFPDPDSDGGFKFLIVEGGAQRFEAATAACRDLAPEGMRDEPPTPEQLDALIELSQCVRDNGVPAFPDPTASGSFDLGAAGIDAADSKLQAAIGACEAAAAPGTGVRITIGG